jgi:hypothetical protein
LNNGDSVVLVVTSSAACVLPRQATSQAYVAVVLPSVYPRVGISVSADTVCQGDTVTFTAFVQNTVGPLTYTWYVNNIYPYYTDSVFITNSLNDGDVVNCYVYCGYSCAIPNNVSSLAIQIHIDCQGSGNGLQMDHVSGISPLTDSAEAVSAQLFPNPSNGKFFIVLKGLNSDKHINIQLFDEVGNLIYNQSNMAVDNNMPLEVNAPANLPEGVYLIRLTNTELDWKKSIVINRK